jgi:hypothetical protein
MTAGNRDGNPMRKPDAETRLAFAGQTKIDQDDVVTSVRECFP